MTYQAKILNSVIFLFCCSSLVFSLACNSPSKVEDAGPPMSEVRKNLGNAFIDNVFESTSSMLLKASPKLNYDYSLEEEKITMSPPDHAKLKKILLSNQSYIFNINKRCLFIPEYAIELQGETNVFILISPSCKQMDIFDKKMVSRRVNIDRSYDEIMAIIDQYQDKL